MIFMAAEMRSTASGEQAWRFRCDVCTDYTLWTPLEQRSEAVAIAHANGWTVEDRILCPVCATAACHIPREANRTTDIDC